MIQELMAQRAELDKQIADAKVAIFDGTVTEIICSAEAAGIAIDKLAAALLAHGKKTARKPVAKAPAKYRQVGGSATWTGRGRKPQWFTAGEHEAV